MTDRSDAGSRPSTDGGASAVNDGRASADAGNPAQLIRDLGTLGGKLTPIKGSGDELAYSRLDDLKSLIAGRTETATLEALAACIADTAPSRTTWKGHPVSLGYMCYQALSRIGYHEPTAADGDVARSWPGALTPRSSPAAQEAASTAWLKVIRSKQLIIP